MTPSGSGRTSAIGSRRDRWALLLAGVAACAGYLGAELYLLPGELGFPLDDSWIHLHFARQLAAGEGLAYNPGELVAGSTAPLWTALLSLLFLLPLDPVLPVKLVGVVLHLAGALAVLVLARELGLSRGLAFLAALLTAATRWLVWSALSGMEISLFVVLGLWGIILHLRERREPSRPPRSPAVLAAAALARPEGLLLLVLALADRLLAFDRDAAGALRWRRPRRLAAGLGPALVVLAPVLLFNTAVGGSPLPTTFAAKAVAAVPPPAAAGGPWGALVGLLDLLPDPHYLYAAPLGIFFGSQPYMLLLAAAGVLVLVGALGTAQDRGLLPALWLLALPLAFAVLSARAGTAIAGNFGRYYFPLFPVLVVLGTLGLARTAAPTTALWRRRPLAVLLAALLVWPTAASLVRGAGAHARHVANVQGSDVRLARWLAERLPPEAVLAVNDIGAFKYFLPNPIVDLAGILHPQVRRYVGEAIARTGDGHPGLLRFLDEQRPDYLVVFPDWYPGLEREDSGFRPLYGLSIPDNLAMGGDRIVVYSTPWTRYPLAADPRLPADPG